MQYFRSSFYHIRWGVAMGIIRDTYRYFSWRVWLLSILIFTLYGIHHIISVFFRVLDEIFHRNYKKQTIRQPVFIIASPRSGTTYLHRLMAMDDERFVYTKNAHTFFMTASFVQFYNLWKWIDRHLLFGAIKKFIAWLDKVFWGGWDDIHPMGFNKAEEDELVFAQQMLSPGVYIPFPFFHLNNASRFLDNEPPLIRQRAMEFYESCVKRFVFRAGKNKTYLAKNVMSTGRYKSLLQKFPDAKIIYIARHPYQAVPSMASMFTIMYGKKVPQDSAARKEWIRYGINFFKYSSDMRKNIASSQFYMLKYDDLLENPEESTLKIYNHFGWNVAEKFAERLRKEHVRSKNYKSTHEYSLEEFGYSKEQVYNELSEVMNELGFKK
ncbi:MAG: sulfotransferase [Chitinophagales bacterium]|nr:sulfotransferase [Chitinophagales bacterium]